MSAAVSENPVDVRSASDHRAKGPGGGPLVHDDEVAVDLGVWLSGIESFLVAGHHSFTDAADAKATQDSSKEFRLVHSALQRCSLIVSRLLITNAWTASPAAATRKITPNDLTELGYVLRDAILLSDGLIHSTDLGPGEWKAWRHLLWHRLDSLAVVSSLIQYAEERGESFLPDQLRKLSESVEPLNAEQSELALILPRFARILKWLSVIGRMLEADEPLKPALLIFSRVNEQIFELTTYINNRLQRFPDEEAELFASLDAASYTASIELKKVYAQELSGLAKLRPSPSIYARMETAHCLLNEGFQQMLAGFAQLVDPKIEVFDLFPNFRVKLDQSLTLRRELWRVAEVVQAAEKNPQKQEIEKLQKALRELMKGTIRFLFYKDTETVERFVEEILVTKQNKDLVPILHRFGAYLDTLLGQVNLRAVLVKYPFDPKR